MTNMEVTTPPVCEKHGKDWMMALGRHEFGCFKCGEEQVAADTLSVCTESEAEAIKATEKLAEEWHQTGRDDLANQASAFAYLIKQVAVQRQQEQKQT